MEDALWHYLRHCKRAGKHIHLFVCLFVRDPGSHHGAVCGSGCRPFEQFLTPGVFGWPCIGRMSRWPRQLLGGSAAGSSVPAGGGLAAGGSAAGGGSAAQRLAARRLSGWRLGSWQQRHSEGGRRACGNDWRDGGGHSVGRHGGRRCSSGTSVHTKLRKPDAPCIFLLRVLSRLTMTTSSNACTSSTCSTRSLDETTHPDEEHASPSAVHRHPRLPRVCPGPRSTRCCDQVVIAPKKKEMHPETKIGSWVQS